MRRRAVVDGSPVSAPVYRRLERWTWCDRAEQPIDTSTGMRPGKCADGTPHGPHGSLFVMAPEEELEQGAWATYNYDQGPYLLGVHESELEALRSAVDGGAGSRVIFLRWGEDIGMAVARERESAG